jgi:N-carbamoylputrescine amidase
MSETGSVAPAPTLPDLTIACVQMAPQVGEKAANIARSLQLIAHAATSGARLVVLPELTSSGYVFASREEAFALAESASDGQAVLAWSAAARQLGIHLVAGFAERDGDRLYNSAAVIGPAGLLGTYRKLHLWSDENLFFEPGDHGLPVFHTEIGRLAAIICYDGWFPEVYRTLALKGADLVAVPTNWVPMPGQEAHRPTMANVLAMAGAHSNGLTVACASRTGVERGQPFIGQSIVVGSDGWPLAGPATAAGEEILLAQVNLQRSRQGRRLNAFNDVLRDRRCDVYGSPCSAGWPLTR